MTELMAPCLLLCDAVPDPAVFWAMVGALGTGVTALVAIVGAYLVYGQVSQIREQSSAHYAEGIKWLTDYYGAENRFTDLVDGLTTFVDANNTLEVRRVLAQILADVDLARQLITKDYLTVDMVYTIIGVSVWRVLKIVDQLKEDERYTDHVMTIISYRPKAYDLMLELRGIFDQSTQKARAWKEGQDGDE